MNNDNEQSHGMHNTISDIARLDERLRNVKVEIQQLEALLERYLTRIEFMAHFWPVRALVYGMAALLLSSVLAAVIAVVIVK